jgi:hypothetical protein
LNRDAAQGLAVQNNLPRDGRRSLFFADGLRLSLGVLSQARDEHQKQEREMYSGQGFSPSIID